jgi:uncharacterized protein (DUF427 family)
MENAMSAQSRERREPGSDHPISIAAEPARVTVRVGDTVVADSTAALRMQEASYPPVHYVPVADLDQSLLTASDTHTYCPYKGEASYHSLSTPDGAVQDALWFYEEPYPAVEQIIGHVAFYTERVALTVGDQDAAEVA